MSGNTFGHSFRVTTFGESHGPAIGAVIDGCPAGLKIDRNFIQNELNRRRPGQSKITTARKETDDFEILSGVFEEITLGSPIAILIHNRDAKSSDYDHLKDSFRPSHADFTYWKKYGIRDHRGGGRASARETAARVAAGAIAKLLIKEQGIQIHAYVTVVGEINMPNPFENVDYSLIESSMVRCPDKEVAEQMISLIEQVKSLGDTVGGIISATISGCPPGLGEPVFDKFQAALAHAMMGINAVKGFEYGSGFDSVSKRGSELNDRFETVDGETVTATNHSGGIQGGITNGMDINFNVAFKPTATIMQDQKSVNTAGESIEIKGKGRHDPCIVPRAVPIVEAMAALVTADLLLQNKTSKL